MALRHPKLQEPVATIGIGVDGTCLFMVDDGHRQAMVGTISLYDREGNRQHTIYLAATPEYGKETFCQRVGAEIAHVKEQYPKAQLTGVADGSEDNRTFLRKYTTDECVDFYHASGYLDLAAKAAHPRRVLSRLEWLEDRRHKLRHEKGYAAKVLEEMKALPTTGLSESALEGLEKARTYFANHYQQMNYAERAEAGLPIGSEVTEAVCKTIVKMRMCRGGAKWKGEGARVVLSLRTLICTEGRWEQLWAKIDRIGFPIAIAA